MLRFFNWTGGFLAGLAALLPSAALGDNSPDFAYPIVSNSEDGTVFCYMQTEDGRILDLGRLCGNSINSSTNTGVRTGRSSGVASRLNAISDSGMGANLGGLNPNNRNGAPCVIFDAQGRPCT